MERRMTDIKKVVFAKQRDPNAPIQLNPKDYLNINEMHRQFGRGSDCPPKPCCDEPGDCDISFMEVETKYGTDGYAIYLGESTYDPVPEVVIINGSYCLIVKKTKK
jgi:hypothetical protein